MPQAPIGVAISLSAAVLALSACAGAGKRPDNPARALAFDRESETRVVYAAVLRDMYQQPGTQQYVIDPRRTAAYGTEDGFLRERVPEARSDTVADYGRRTSGGAMPRDLDVQIPVTWFGEGDWTALVPQAPGAPDPMDERWQAFHRRFPGPSGWIEFSDVGFSRDGREALLHVGSSFDSLGGAGNFVLLERAGPGWRVRRKARTWVS